jgi:hypothetical protein
MRCLSPPEAEALFGQLGFRFSLDQTSYRSALVLASERAEHQSRIAAEQPSDFRRIAHFIRSINRWLPPNRERLFWADHWETGVFGGYEDAMVVAAWRGLGEPRTLDESPGLLLDAQNWDEEDQTETGPAQAEALGVLVGVVTMLMMTNSDGWLISAGSVDRIEFWEGHFFFHSDDKTQLKRANDIVDEFGCSRWKTSD